jgi:signal transduction histidine kinase
VRLFRKAGTRIAAVGTAVTLIVLSSFALAAHFTTRTMMVAAMDDELDTLCVAIASDLEQRGLGVAPPEVLRSGVEANALAFRLEHHSAVLFDRDEVLAATGDLAHRVTIAELRKIDRRDERPFTAREPFTGQGRLCRFRIAKLGEKASGTTLVIFRSIESITRTLELADAALATFVAAGLLASALILTIAVRRALSPVEKITDFAERVTARDLSERIGVSEAGDEFTRLAAVINSLLDRLSATFASQQRLIADAAHELKTPTAVIAAEAQELARGRLEGAEAREAAAVIARAAEGLAREADDLLELARGDVSPRPREMFDVDEAVEEAVAAVSPLAAEKAIAIVRDSQGRGAILGDRAGMIRAITNLIANAVRYSPRDSEVVVSCNVAAEHFTIDIADRGMGVAEEDRSRIFERFVRLPHARRDHPEGSGLGLAIVEQVISAHGGSVEALSRDGGGSVFRLRVPVRRA